MPANTRRVWKRVSKRKVKKRVSKLKIRKRASGRKVGKRVSKSSEEKNRGYGWMRNKARYPGITSTRRVMESKKRKHNHEVDCVSFSEIRSDRWKKIPEAQTVGDLGVLLGKKPRGHAVKSEDLNKLVKPVVITFNNLEGVQDHLWKKGIRPIRKKLSDTQKTKLKVVDLVQKAGDNTDDMEDRVEEVLEDAYFSELKNEDWDDIYKGLNHDDFLTRGIYLGGKLVAVIIAWDIPKKKHRFIVQLGIRTDFQSMGLGKVLLENVKNDAPSNRLALQVNKANPAITWYFLQGFNQWVKPDRTPSEGCIFMKSW